MDLFANYLEYTKDTESPVIYHRWCYISILAASLGRKTSLAHGHFRVFPNLYIMLIGEPAARKSTSIKIAKKLLSRTSYNTFAADKTGKEKFLLDLEGLSEDDVEAGSSRKTTKRYDAVTADNLWGTSLRDPREVFIVADEFNEFAGVGNLDFFTTLGNLWDWDNEEPFTQRFKNSKSVSIYQPTVNILAGNTPELFARAFPPEAIGSGFLSRLLLIHGERSGRRITFPPPPDEQLGESLVAYLKKIQTNNLGPLTCDSNALSILDKIYQSSEESEIPDIRFKAYSNRRFTQLLRLCNIFAAGKFQLQITEEDVLQANTVLTHAELLMPKAMGEFGKSKHSDVVNKIMEALEKTVIPLSIPAIFKQVHRDVNQKELVEIMANLSTAQKVQVVSGPGGGFLPRKEVRKEPKYVDWNFLTTEERNML